MGPGRILLSGPSPDLRRGSECKLEEGMEGGREGREEKRPGGTKGVRESESKAERVREGGVREKETRGGVRGEAPEIRRETRI